MEFHKSAPKSYLRGSALILTFRPSPVPLPNKEPTPNCPRVRFPGLVDKKLLSLDNSASLALIIHSNHLTANGKLLPSAGWWEWLQECDFALAINCTTGIKLRDAWNRGRFLSGVEVDDLGVCEFKGFMYGERLAVMIHIIAQFSGSNGLTKDNRVCWEDGEIGVEFLESISRSAFVQNSR
jgi:hypothetical protein